MPSRRELLRQLGLTLLAAACGPATGVLTPAVKTAPPPRSSVTGRPPSTTTSVTTTSVTSTTTPATRIFELRPRGDWAAREPRTDLLGAHFGPLSYLTVHHAGDTTGLTGPERYRIWQDWHMDARGWGDLVYHYIIGIDGVVWTGRDISYRGDTATEYDPDRHFLVVVEGNFDLEEPTAAQIQVLPLVLAWASERWVISPTSVAGHRDYSTQTSCPGATLYPYMASGSLQADVEAILASGGAEPG